MKILKNKINKEKIFLNLSALAIIFLFAIIIASCTKEEFYMDKLNTSGNWKPDVALPLVYSSLTMEDILADYDNHHIVNDANKLCYLVYQKNVRSANADAVIIVPNQYINTVTNFNITGGNLGTGSDYTTTYNKVYTFNFTNGEVIDSIYIKFGLFVFNITSDLNYDASVVVTLPTVTKNGVPFSTTLTLNAGDNPFYALNLDGYVMKLGAQPINEDNKMPVRYDITVHGNGSNNNSPYNISFNEYISSIQFSKIYGYLGQFTFDMLVDTVNIKLYNNNLTGFIDYEDPRIYLTMTSSFGMPIGIFTTNFLAKPTHDSPNSVNITGSAVPTANNPHILPAVPFNNPGHMMTETVYLDRNNSSVYNAMLISPRYFYCKPNVSTNPAGNTQNFAIDSSHLDFNMKVELPMHGKAWDFVLQDTIPFEFEGIDEMESIQFNVDVLNDFPIDGIAQVYFADTAYNVLDSLLNPIQSAIISATPGPAPDYLVTQPVRKYTTTTLTEQRLKNLKNMKYFLIKSYLTSYNDGGNIVKIYSFYTIDVKISARAKFRVNY